MPQSERSQIIKEFMLWLDAKTSQDNGATLREILNHIVVEITDLGSTEKRARSYIDSLRKHGLIAIHGYRFKVTQTGKNWLKRKV